MLACPGSLCHEAEQERAQISTSVLQQRDILLLHHDKTRMRNMSFQCKECSGQLCQVLLVDFKNQRVRRD